VARRDTIFLVEHYAPGSDVERLRAAAARVRAAERGRVRLLQATIVPDDDSLLCLVAAPSKSVVRTTCERAGVAPDRISVAVPDLSLEPRPKGEHDGT
jgi:hypothetical protein